MNDWMQGTGTDALAGTTAAPLIDDYVTAYIQDPLDILLASYKTGCGVSVASTSTLSVAAGEVTCSNSAGTIRRFRRNTAAVTAAIDTGSLASSTTYYVYLTADTNDTAFAASFSIAAYPSGSTYFRKIGVLTTNSSAEITSVSSYYDSGALTQRVCKQDATYTSSSSAIPYDDSVPLISEGTDVPGLTVTFVPSSATSKICVKVDLHQYSYGTAVLFKDSVAVATSWQEAGPAYSSFFNHIIYDFVSGTTSAITFTVRIGVVSTIPGTGYVNGVAAGRIYGGTLLSTIEVNEYR